MGFSLYELVHEETAILEAAIAARMAEGDTQEQAVEKAVAALDMLTDEKVIRYACLIKGFEAEAEAIRTEEWNLGKRRGTLEKQAEALRQRMVDLLPHNKKWKAPQAEVSFGKSLAVQVTELDKIPAEYRRDIPATWAPDKNAIKAALKAGTKVEGTQMQENWNVKIS